MARKILFRQCAGRYDEMIGEPTEEEKEAIMKEFGEALWPFVLGFEHISDVNDLSNSG